MGVWVRPGNLNGSCVRDPVAGLWTAISPPVARAVPFGVGVWLCFEMDQKVVLWDRWWSLVVPEWVLVSITKLSFVFPSIYGISVVSLVRWSPVFNGPAPPCSMVPLAFVFLVFCEGFKGGKVRSKWNRSEIDVRQIVSNGFKWFQVISSDFKWFQMITNDFEWFQFISNDFKWLQMISNDFKWFRMISSDFKWFQMISNDFKWFQMISSYFKWFQIISNDFKSFQMISSDFKSFQAISNDFKWFQMISNDSK